MIDLYKCWGNGDNDNKNLTNLPNINKLDKFTTIELQDEPEITNLMRDEIKKLKNDFKFIPPLFNQYVICMDITERYRQFSYEEFEKQSIPPNEYDKRWKQALKYFGGEPLYSKDLIQWYDEKTFFVLNYTLNKKTFIARVEYKFKDDKAYLDITSYAIAKDYIEMQKNEFNTYKKDVADKVLFILAVSNYMLTYNNNVEYEKIEYRTANNENKNHSQQSNNKSSVKKNNKITLKSKKTKYIITKEDIENAKKRKYTPIKPSWYVRGYYQRFGKNKEVKYVPPRINKRHPDKLAKPEPEKSVYVIKK